jgi:site-specific DNA recombinase
VRIALYARVSTNRQQLTHTIEQQVTRLRAYVVTQPDWSLAEEHIFCDDGYSGASLKRPGLDLLRDQAAQAAFGLVLMTVPDRLARNYVHQMVLLEEFARYGCQVHFVDRPPTNDPHDHLVLQIRGAVAEYERTLIAERMRRGRQSKIRNGLLLPWTRTPYGYRADPERPRDPRVLGVDAVQAAIVHELFAAYASGGVSLYALAVQLTARKIPSPTGKAHWTAQSIRMIITNPVYAGTAYGYRTRDKPALHRKSALQVLGAGVSYEARPESEWVGVPVPAIVSQEVFKQAQARLATNQRQARRNTRHDYLLRTLICCGHCRFQCHGQTMDGDHVYYICGGKRASAGPERCAARYIPARQVEELVWQDLCTVLQEPTLITMALERAANGAWVPEAIQQRLTALQTALRSLDSQRERLLTAYLAGVVELPEFERRQRELVQQRDDVVTQERQLLAAQAQTQELYALIPCIHALCERLQSGLDQATHEQRRQLIELLIDAVIVTGEQIEIRYVIPTTEASTHTRFCHLRKDYFDSVVEIVNLPRSTISSSRSR